MRPPAFPRRSLECWRAWSRGVMQLDLSANSMPQAVHEECMGQVRPGRLPGRGGPKKQVRGCYRSPEC